MEAMKEEDALFPRAECQDRRAFVYALSNGSLTEQMNGRRIPIAKIHEHENVHHLLRNHHRLNMLLLLVSSVSFSTNGRCGANLGWKE